MKKRGLILALVLIATVISIALSGKLVADEPKAGGGDMDPQAMMQAMQDWMDSMNPGDHHKRLNDFVGDYNVEMRVFMMPGQEPIVTKGTSSIKWVLGKRYLMEEFDCEMKFPDMQNPGQMQTLNYDGIGMTGYNNTRNLYEGTWASTGDTAIYSMKGTWPPDSKVMNFYGEMDEPMMNMYGRVCNFRTTIVDANKRKFEIFDLAAGPDHKVIEIIYTKK